MSFEDINYLHSLTPIQKKYLLDQHRFSVTTAGRRSRKTLLSESKLQNRMLERMKFEKGGRYFHAAPTYTQAYDIFWERLKKNTKPFWSKQPSESKLIVYLLRDYRIHVVGLDKPARIEGRPWHGGHITEFGNIKAKAWGENIQPLFADTNGFCLIDGVPEGRNHYYKRALYSAGGIIPKTLPFQGAYSVPQEDPDWAFFSWFSSDVLTPQAIASAKRDLDKKTFLQEYEGSFESTQGLAYYNYSTDNHKNCKYNPNLPVHIGMDFNVNPMTATISHIYSNVIEQFEEEYLTDSNTYEMGEVIRNKYGIQNVNIYPDATGGARESNAKETDLAILRNMGFNVIANSTNPFVTDRINNVNSKIKSTSGNVTFFLNPETCPKTDNDLKSVERLDDGRENKDQEKQGLVHISSALGYMISYLFPINSGGIYAN